jgi:2-polyprenyl-3-methyl-5-hydroxy-6-metoxy-1,4-benzoquinol methylase
MARHTEIKCYLCGCTEHDRRPGKVRDDGSLEILECQGCGLVFLSRTQVPERFYEQSGMHNGEPQPVEEWLRDTDWDDERRFRFLDKEITNRVILDFGCGVGGFLLKARTKARQVMGVELESRLAPHFKTSGLSVVQNIDLILPQQRFDLITAFHVVEHLDDPAGILARLAEKLIAGGKLVVEVPSADDALLTIYKSRPFSEFTYWSCHQFLFNASTLLLLARKAGLQVECIKHVQRYPLANHLYWLAKGLPGGHRAWSFLSNEEVNSGYEASLAAIGKTDTVMAILTPHSAT